MCLHASTKYCRYEQLTAKESKPHWNEAKTTRKNKQIQRSQTQEIKTNEWNTTTYSTQNQIKQTQKQKTQSNAGMLAIHNTTQKSFIKINMPRNLALVFIAIAFGSQSYWSWPSVGFEKEQTEYVFFYFLHSVCISHNCILNVFTSAQHFFSAPHDQCTSRQVEEQSSPQYWLLFRVITGGLSPPQTLHSNNSIKWKQVS